MPTGVYVRTEEIKERLRIAHKGKPSSWKGQHPSLESREKMRLSHLGKTPWNKGKKTGPAWNSGLKQIVVNNCKCKVCGRQRYLSPAYIKRGDGKYCSSKCFGIGTSGEKSSHWKGGFSKTKEYRIALKNRRRLNGGKLSIQTIQQVYEDNIKQYGTLTCYLCLKHIQFKQDSIDHRIPLTRGGTNEYNNLAIAHLSCNKKKNTKTEKEYRSKLWLM